MKNFWKILGIIALVAVIGFSMAACGGDDDDDTKKPGTDTPGTDTPGTDTPSTGGDNGGAYSAIAGTWVGDETNGTLVITKDEFKTDNGVETNAYAVVYVMNGMKTALAAYATQGMDASMYAKDGKIGYSLMYSGTDMGEVIYSYTIEGNTLTLTDDDDAVAFTGAK